MKNIFLTFIGLMISGNVAQAGLDIYYGGYFIASVSRKSDGQDFDAASFCNMDLHNGQEFNLLSDGSYYFLLAAEDGNGTHEFQLNDYSDSVSSREVSCSKIVISSESEINASFDTAMTALADAKADFKEHVNTIPAKILTDGAVIEMRNNLQAQLEEALNNKLNAQLEQYIQDRLAILVPQKVSEQVEQALKDRGL